VAGLALDGSIVAVGGGFDDGVAVWDLDPERWLNGVCRVAGRNLTPEEWTTHIGDLVPYRETCPDL